MTLPLSNSNEQWRKHCFGFLCVATRNKEMVSCRVLNKNAISGTPRKLTLDAHSSFLRADFCTFKIGTNVSQTVKIVRTTNPDRKGYILILGDVNHISLRGRISVKFSLVEMTLIQMRDRKDLHGRKRPAFMPLVSLKTGVERSPRKTFFSLK